MAGTMKIGTHEMAGFMIQQVHAASYGGAANASSSVGEQSDRYANLELFQKVLQSIWHQVNTAGEVFTVGVIQPDNTVKGGTGWAAELARHWGKPLHVFDQERKGWFVWRDHKWAPVTNPVIGRTRFTGTGTRFLSDDGRAAIRALFERSFGGVAK